MHLTLILLPLLQPPQAKLEIRETNTLLLSVDNEELESAQVLLDKFLDLREKFYRKDVTLGIVNSNNSEVLEYFNKIFGLPAKKDPNSEAIQNVLAYYEVIGLKTPRLYKSIFDSYEISTETMYQFYKDVMKKKVSQYLPESIPPQDNGDRLIQEVVTSSFQELVLKNPLDIRKTNYPSP